MRTLLSVIPEPPAGLRDRATILTMMLTGRRRAEVLNLRAGDLSLDEETIFSPRHSRAAHSTPRRRLSSMVHRQQAARIAAVEEARGRTVGAEVHQVPG